MSEMSEERQRAAGWQIADGEPPGTFVWCEGEDVLAVAIWAEDHWEYVTDTWSGSVPPPGVFPDGAADPRAGGWWQAPDGQWYGPPPSPASPSAPAPPHHGWVRAGWVLLAAVVVLTFVGLRSLKADYGIVRATDLLDTVPPLPAAAEGYQLWLVFGLAALACAWSTARLLIARSRHEKAAGPMLRAEAFALLAVVGGAVVLAQRLRVDCLYRHAGSITANWSSTYRSIACDSAATARAAAVWEVTDRGAALLVVLGAVTAGIVLILYVTRDAALEAPPARPQREASMADAPPERQLADEKAQRHLQVAAFCTVAGIVGTFIGLYGVGLLSALGVVLVAAGSGVALVVMASPATPAGRRRTSSLLVLVSTVWVGLLAIGALGSASA